MTEETNKPNKFGEALQEWWDSDACKKLQEASEESVQKASTIKFTSNSTKMQLCVPRVYFYSFNIIDITLKQ